MENNQQNVSEPVLGKLKLFIFSKKGLFFTSLLIIFLLPWAYWGLLKQIPVPKSPSTSPNKTVLSAEKIWQMTLLYDTRSNALTVKEIHIDSGTAPASPIETSPYVAEVLNADNKVLFKTHFNLTVDLAYNLYFAPGISSDEAKISLPPPKKIIEKNLALPFLSQGKTIRILNNNLEMLRFTPPQLTSFSLFSTTYAQSSPANCNPIHIVLIAEGYTDFNQFQKDADLAQSSLLSAAPFSENKGKLDFKKLQNDKPLGCIQGDRLASACINNDSTFNRLSAEIKRQFPNLPLTDGAVKKVVLVNAKAQKNSGKNYITGISEAGGERSVISTHIDVETLPTNQDDFQAKLYIHEIGGHLISRLYDRFLYTGIPESDKLKDISEHPTNCSMNSAGEDFWKTARPLPAGGKNAYPFCTISSAFGPAEQSSSCDINGMQNRGTPDSVMSTLDCGGATNRSFDKVEQAVIAQVLSGFSACTASEPAANTPSNPATGNSGGHLICASVAQRYDSDTLTLENNLAETVTLDLQQNYCPYQGHPQRDGDPDCTGFSGTKTFTIKPGQKIAYKMGRLLKCKNNALVAKNVRTAGPNQGCYRDDNNQPWDGGKAFAVKSLAPQPGQTCDPDPTPGENLVNSVTATEIFSAPGGTLPAAAQIPSANCHPDPSCSQGTKNIHLCKLVCSP